MNGPRPKDISAVVTRVNLFLLAAGIGGTLLTLSRPESVFITFITADTIFWFSSSVVQGLFAAIAVLAMFSVFRMESLRNIQLRAIDDLREVNERTGYVEDTEAPTDLVQEFRRWRMEADSDVSHYMDIERILNEIHNTEVARESILETLKGQTLIVFIVISVNVVALLIAERLATTFPSIMYLDLALTLIAVQSLWNSIFTIVERYSRISGYDVPPMFGS